MKTLKYLGIAARSLVVAAPLLLMAACGGGGGKGQLDFSAAKTNLKGTVQGLTNGNSITLTNGTDTLTLSADSAFTFPSQLLVGSTYSMAIAALPANQSCVATYAQGTVSAEVPPPVKVICGVATSTTETFVATGSLTTARLGHTATKLANGKVLVTGGYNVSNNSLASAELYDPTTGLWTSTGNLLATRVDHAATLLPNGKVLVSGGADPVTGVRYMGTELYDPSVGTWTATGNLNFGRINHSTTLINGKVLLAGGVDQNSGINIASTEQYDPATGVWTLKGNLSTARVNHTATALSNGKVMLVGGVDNGANILKAAELYDPATGLWSATFSPFEPKSDGLATLLADGKVLVYGGMGPSGFVTNSEIFNPASTLIPWAYASADSTAQSHVNRTATLLPNGKVLFAGGSDTSGSNILTTSNEIFDPSTGLWSATAKLISARVGHTATLLDNGKVLVVGGYALQSSALGTTPTAVVSASAELYVVSAATPSWHAAGSLATARTLHTSTLLDSGNVLVVGGDTSYDNAGTGVLSSVEIYNAATGAWTTAASNLINARYGHTATLLPNGKVLVAGGASSASTRLSSAELYDPASGLWSATGSMLSGHNRHTATLLPNGKVLVVGSGLPYYYSNAATSHAELYDPATGAWTATGAVIHSRDFHSAVLLSNGKVLVMGGNDGYGATIGATAEIYDPTTNAWIAIANLTKSRIYPGTALLPDGNVLITGSDYGSLQGTAELFDPATNTFAATGPIPVAAGCFAVSMTGAVPVLLPSGKVLLSGGFNCAKISEYDTTTGVWTARTPFTTTFLMERTVTLLKNGRVLSIAGGGIDEFPTAVTELYW
jgi:N-acetylneuraminic acid mutarotase